MRIRKTGWVVWDKKQQQVYTRGRMFVFYDKTAAWLSAHKERKDSPYKVIKVKITVEPIKKLQ